MTSLSIGSALPAIPDIVVQILFALFIFAAAVAVITDTYAEFTLGSLILLTIWLTIQIFGVSVLTALLLVLFFIAVRVYVDLFDVLGEADYDSQLIAIAVDAFLSDSNSARDEQDP